VEHVHSVESEKRNNADGILPLTKKFRGTNVGLGALERGHAIVDEIRNTLQRLDVLHKKRYSYQVEMCEMFLSALAPTIYMDAYRDHAAQIMIRNKWRPRDMNSLCLVQTQRQAGKSTVVALFLAAVMLCRPSTYIIIVATALKQARIILKDTKKFIRLLKPDIHFSVDNNFGAEIDLGQGDTRTVEALPVNPSVGKPPLSSPQRAPSDMGHSLRFPPQLSSPSPPLLRAMKRVTAALRMSAWFA
jgi:hypothetical protein